MSEEKTIDRIYKCTDKTCDGVIKVTEPLFGGDFLKECPFCHNDSLVIDYADCGISVLFDTKKPKTAGMLGQKNFADRERREGKKTKGKAKLPFWRQSRKINFEVLKNSKRYIESGNI